MADQLKNPSEWTTGGDAPTDKQKNFLATLANDKKVDIDPDSLNKAEASKQIDKLKNMESSGSGQDSGAGSNGKPIQDPDSWTTGGESATGKQTGYIQVMAREAGESIDTTGMGKTDASKTIEQLKEKTGM